MISPLSHLQLLSGNRKKNKFWFSNENERIFPLFYKTTLPDLEGLCFFIHPVSSENRWKSFYPRMLWVRIRSQHRSMFVRSTITHCRKSLPLARWRILWRRGLLQWLGALGLKGSVRVSWFIPLFCLELVQAEGSCNGCKHSDYNVDDSAPEHVFVFCHNCKDFRLVVKGGGAPFPSGKPSTFLET